ncbi:MAG: PorT family protein [Bacteroidales bacterium]|nr:PorT family protein [Bacteroidales bacterium]
MKNIFCLAALFLSVSSIVRAEDDPKRKAIVELNLPILYILPSQEEAMFLIGGSLNAGVYVSPRSFLALEIGVSGHSGDTTAYFSYTKTDQNTGKSETFNDGVVIRKYTAVPLLASWNYVFDFTKRFHLRVGPVIGVTWLITRDRYKPVVDDAPKAFSDTHASFNFGANIGLIWDIGKLFSVGAGYKLMGSTVSELDEYYKLKSSAHQVNFTFEIRF